MQSRSGVQGWALAGTGSLRRICAEDAEKLCSRESERRPLWGHDGGPAHQRCEKPCPCKHSPSDASISNPGRPSQAFLSFSLQSRFLWCTVSICAECRETVSSIYSCPTSSQVACQRLYKHRLSLPNALYRADGNAPSSQLQKCHQSAGLICKHASGGSLHCRDIDHKNKQSA